MEWTMPNVQHGSDVPTPEQGAQSKAQNIGLNESPPISQGKPASKPLSFSNSTRWVPHRKAEVVDAVRSGQITLDETCERFAMSIEEFLTWQRGIKLSGLAGLRVSGVQPRKRPQTLPDDSGHEPRGHRKASRRESKET
jgi:hypothetical protein